MKRRGGFSGRRQMLQLDTKTSKSTASGTNQGKVMWDYGKSDDETSDLDGQPLSTSAVTYTSHNPTSTPATVAVTPQPQWVACLDTNTNHYYYWNSSTNEVIWQLPEGVTEVLLDGHVVNVSHWQTAASATSSAAENEQTQTEIAAESTMNESCNTLPSTQATTNETSPAITTKTIDGKTESESTLVSSPSLGAKSTPAATTPIAKAPKAGRIVGRVALPIVFASSSSEEDEGSEEAGVQLVIKGSNAPPLPNTATTRRNFGTEVALSGLSDGENKISGGGASSCPETPTTDAGKTRVSSMEDVGLVPKQMLSVPNATSPVIRSSPLARSPSPSPSPTPQPSQQPSPVSKTPMEKVDEKEKETGERNDRDDVEMSEGENKTEKQGSVTNTAAKTVEEEKASGGKSVKGLQPGGAYAQLNSFLAEIAAIASEADQIEYEKEEKEREKEREEERKRREEEDRTKREVAREEEEVTGLAAVIQSKLRFLGYEITDPTSFAILAVEIQTRLLDWQAGALPKSYLLARLSEAEQRLTAFEQQCMPPEWHCVWDQTRGHYVYINDITGDRSDTYPGYTYDSGQGGDSTRNLSQPPPPPPPPEDGVPPPPPPPADNEGREEGEVSDADMDIDITPPGSPAITIRTKTTISAAPVLRNPAVISAPPAPPSTVQQPLQTLQPTSGRNSPAPFSSGEGGQSESEQERPAPVDPYINPSRLAMLRKRSPSPRAESPGPVKKKPKKKVKAGGVGVGDKKVSSLLNKWAAAGRELAGEDEGSSGDEGKVDPNEWARQQMMKANNRNANFASLGGGTGPKAGWREKVMKRQT